MNCWKQLSPCGKGDPIRAAANACKASGRRCAAESCRTLRHCGSAGGKTPTVLPGRSDTAPRCAGPTGAGSRCAGQKCGAAPGVGGQGLFGGGRLRYAPKTGRQMFYTANGNSSHANQTFLCSFFRLPIRRTVFMVKIQSVFMLIGNSFLKRSAKEACRMFIRRRPSDATAV